MVFKKLSPEEREAREREREEKEVREREDIECNHDWVFNREFQGDMFIHFVYHCRRCGIISHHPITPLIQSYEAEVNNAIEKASEEQQSQKQKKGKFSLFKGREQPAKQ